MVEAGYVALDPANMDELQAAGQFFVTTLTGALGAVGFFIRVFAVHNGAELAQQLNLPDSNRTLCAHVRWFSVVRLAGMPVDAGNPQKS